MDAGGRATPGAVAETRAASHDSRDGGGRATHGAVAEGRPDCGFALPVVRAALAQGCANGKSGV